MKLTTLCFLVDEHRILLAMKKRGFGVGRWNGVGGKVSGGETIVDAVIREAKEEIEVDIQPTDLRKVAVQHFSFVDRPDFEQLCHVYLTDRWVGIPAETEEMSPRWFSMDDLPFDRMWVGDPHWLPFVLKGNRLKNTFLFSADTKDLISHEVKVVPPHEEL